jgi:hypothetical protein
VWTSGTTGVSTTDASAVKLIDMPQGSRSNYLRITNTGTADGFYSLDGGTTWGYLPAAVGGVPAVVESWDVFGTSPLVKRRTADLSGVFAEVNYFGV